MASEQLGRSISDEDLESDASSDDQEHDEELGEAVVFTHQEGPPTKKQRLTKAELYKPPTNEEMHQLKETENLFQSSLLRMQITEMLAEVLLKTKKQNQISHYVGKLKDILISLPEGKEYDLAQQKWQKKNIKIPILQEPMAVKGKFKFVAPTQVKIIGSFPLGTCIKPNVCVNVAVTMPKDCMQAKDHLDQRYLRKRALYLATIAWKLSGTDIQGELAFAYHHGNHMKPILVIKPAVQFGKHFKVHLHVCADPEAFKLNRFHVKKNNIRSQWYRSEGGSEGSEMVQPPTPHYNTWVLTDLAVEGHLQHLEDIIAKSEGVRDGIVLLKVWLHQRELDQGYGSMSGFVISMYVAYLLTGRKLSTLMSSYQVFRNTIIHLSQANWVSEGISMAGSDPDPHRPTLGDFHQAFDVVFVDNSGYVNLCADMTKTTFRWVQHEARLAVEQLENTAVDSFEMLFSSHVPFIRKFDHIFHISKLENCNAAVKKLEAEDDVMDHCGNALTASLPRLLKILDKAVGRRVYLMAVKPVQHEQWSIDDPPPQYTALTCISIGLLLNPDSSQSLLEKGPPADSPEAAEFRAFWGEKSELRRFQDGSINEAVVWDCKTLAEKRLISTHIIKHILLRHAGIPRDSITYRAGQLDTVLKLPPAARRKSAAYGTGEEQHLDVIRVYDGLAKQLRNLKDFPLTINTVQGTSPVFRFAEVFPAMPANHRNPGHKDGDAFVPQDSASCPPYTPAMAVLCVLEGSGKWPEDAAAVQRLKAAFHIKMADILEDQNSLITTVYPDCVHVLKDGYVFRVQLAYMREIALLKMVKTPDGMVKMVDTKEALALEHHLVAVPKLTSTLHGIQQQHASFSSTVRLAKRWVGAQLLAGHVTDEALELIVAHLFLCPAPYTTPNSPLVGFLRFLHLMSKHNWNTVPLIINPNNELTKEDCTEIHNRFTKNRSALPLMFVSTPWDKFGSIWTKEIPTAQILNRLVLLAQESLKVLENKLSDHRIDVDFKQIFRAPLEVYDVLIHLNHEQQSRYHHTIDVAKEVALSKYKPSEATDQDKAMPVTEFNPAKLYLQELQESFGELALFFHDPYGGNLIAVLWKPQAFTPQSFKVSSAHCRMPDTATEGTEVQMVPNVPAILEDMKTLGDGLVKFVETRTKK